MMIQNNNYVINNKEIVIAGQKIPNPPCDSWTNVTVINNNVFVNGYEYKNGQWKRTLRALWHLWF